MKLSKSKLALAKVINENGGWPDEGKYLVQQDDLGLYASTGKPIWMKKSGRFSIEYCAFICDAKKITNRHQAVLSREEYYQAYPKADDDGWIEWNGGECPVGESKLVDYKLLSGSVVTIGELAGDLRWSHKFSTANIIAYRLHKQSAKCDTGEGEINPVVKTEFCKSVTRSITDQEEKYSEITSIPSINQFRCAVVNIKPTIEQLAQDYRNKLDFANRKQLEADDAKSKSDAALGELVAAGKTIDLVISISTPDPEMMITDWRDLRVNDVIFVGKYDDHESGEYVVIELEDRDYGEGYAVKTAGIDGNVRWIDARREWRFIRRP